MRLGAAGIVFLGMILQTTSVWAEALCFRTAHEAAVESGVRDGMGFRLEGVRMDALRGTSWATVRSCLHPEQPGQTVRVADAPAPRGTGQGLSTTAAIPAVLVHANDAVTVVQSSGSVRLQLAGVAQENRGAGQRVHVRVGAAGQQRVLEGLVQTDGAIELQPAGVTQ